MDLTKAKEIIAAFQEFLKAWMQPLITVCALVLLFKYSSTASADWSEVLLIVKGVIGFWFVITFGKSIAGMSGSNSSSPKASSGTSTVVTGDATADTQGGSVLPSAPTSLVKDRVEVAMKLAATDEGMWDVLFGRFKQRVGEAVEHMLQLNPSLGTIENAQKAMEEAYKVRLDSKQCGILQSILGLPQAIFAQTDTTILANIKAAIEKDPVGMGWQKEQWRGIAVQWAKEGTIREAADRVKNVNLPMEKRVAALTEFGVSVEDAARSGREGMSRVWYTIPGGTGQTPMEFGDGYWLLGFTL